MARQFFRIIQVASDNLDAAIVIPRALLQFAWLANETADDEPLLE
jgi:hypothetical protein